MTALPILAVVLPAVFAAEPAAGDPLRLPGLLCFWDFQEPAGSPRVAKGPHAYALEERNGPIQREQGGIWGPYSARITRGQWFRIVHPACPALDLHGLQTQYTILA